MNCVVVQPLLCIEGQWREERAKIDENAVAPAEVNMIVFRVCDASMS
jgi:hypothetical protein